MWQGTKNIYHFFQAILANTIYLFPSRGLIVIGVTGTDGKTTTANLIYHILIEAGQKAALISTTGAVINGKASDIGFHVTTPGRFAVQSYIKKARKAGVKYVVLETTSHALDQHRVAGIHFNVGVVTNVSKEHLDYHKTYMNYLKAKAKLLKKAHVAILNKDDQSYKHFKKILKHKDVITYGMKSDATINPHNFQFRTKLMGKFNQYNALAAAAAVRILRIPDDAIKKGLASFKLPEGRQQILYDKQFTVINDFAHTPNSFANILPEIKKLAKNRVIHVFGAAAKRDTYKRPEMGKISAEYADIIILTAEDPRNEPIEKIMDEIADGIPEKKFDNTDYQVFRDSEMKFVHGKKYLFRIPDREDAIQFAIQIAQKGDVVVMTGKGHERSMNYGHGEIPWNENEVVKKAIEERRDRGDGRNK